MRRSRIRPHKIGLIMQPDMQTSIYQQSLSMKQRGEVELDTTTLADHPTPFLYLFLTLEKTNQTQYLKPNNLSSAIIDQAMRRSRIRQHNIGLIMQPDMQTSIYQRSLLIKQRGEVESDTTTLADHPTPFLYLFLTLEKTNQTQYLKPNNLSSAIIDQAKRRNRIRHHNIGGHPDSDQ